MLKDLLKQAEEIRNRASESNKTMRSSGGSAFTQQALVEAMNRMEMIRRKNLQANQEKMERLMAAQQAAMGVAQQQKAQEQPAGGPQGQQQGPMGPEAQQAGPPSQQAGPPAQQPPRGLLGVA